ncbi:MAG TPA: caspase family protein [Cyclobacteriaceae bacterium]|nr:caspase family protein [Cyclobacteriaceae bacterium]
MKLLFRLSLTTVVIFMLATGITQAQKEDYKIYDDGVIKFKDKNYDGVISDFTGILDNVAHIKKLDEDLYFYRGQSYYFKGEYDKSLSDLKQSLTLNHYNKGVIHWYMARCYDKLNRVSEAKSDYKEAGGFLEKNRKVYPEFLADRAQFLSRQGEQDAAQQDLTLASSLDPQYSSTKLNGASDKSRGANDKGSNTKVIVTSKPKKEEPKKTTVTQNQKPAQQTTQQQEQEVVEPVKTLPVSLGEMYKDEKRYALVIGNSTYSQEIGVLKNPANDATDIAQELKSSNFEVQLLINATYVQLREAVRKFHEKLTNGPRDQTVGLFYYAGHGIQFQDENYLVPIDAKVQYEDDIVRMCFPVQRMVLANMERSNSRMNIVILDACRNNPFPAATRSAGAGGLSEMKRARGSFIAYATAPGSVAADGSGRNGLYTQELLKAMRKPGRSIEQVFKDVRMSVLRLSGESQNTWDSSNIVGEFYFKF